jgi:hypothetical protein
MSLTPGPVGSRLYALASGAITGPSNSGDINVAGNDAVAVDVSVTSISGSSTPGIEFWWQRKGADGVYYDIYDSGAISAAGTKSATVGKGFSYASTVAIPQSIGSTGRLRWALTGGASSVTASASVTTA